ncbi:MAG: putative collagen-binding domain-containing protein, partial [Armatimonadota bacterium]
RFDCSKLDQWEIVFSHMDKVGIQLHVVTTEAENWRKLGGTRDLNPLRKLYYRELIARFAHHLAVLWNLGEENGNSDAERKAFAEYIRSLDPYDHPITVHTYFGKADVFYNGLLGDPRFEATSIQGQGASYNHWAASLRERSRQAGRPWAIYGDEQGPPVDSGLKNLDQLRTEALWGNLMGGGAGVEWYCGYQGNFGDMTSEDFRVAERLWRQTALAVRFFRDQLPFHEMEPYNELAKTASDALVLAKAGQVYAVYLPKGGTAELDLGQMTVPFTVQWFNPRSGGGLQRGDVRRIAGPGTVSLGRPPEDPNLDWVALVRAIGQLENQALGVHGGHGGGEYPVGATVRIVADPGAPGHVFDRWTGDVEFLADPAAARALVTIPARPIVLTATYREGVAEHAVTKFTLINADADRPIGRFDPLPDGAVVNLAKLPTRNLNIVAHTSTDLTGSVRFALDGDDNFRLENSAPYALAGDTNGNYGAWTPTVGKHTLTATPYSQARAEGQAGRALTITFEVVDRAE